MSNWTPKQALSELMRKFRQSGSGESSSYSSGEPEDGADQQETQSGYPSRADQDGDDAPVSPLALMNENSPEAWLGQFLLMLDMGGVTRFGTITGARRDEELRSRLLQVKASSSADTPLALLDPETAADLKARDWAAWWRAQSALTGYCYSALALSMLGDNGNIADLSTMYRQSYNSRIQRDAHYVLCFMLGKEWPGYNVTAGDIERLSTSA